MTIFGTIFAAKTTKRRSYTSDRGERERDGEGGSIARVATIGGGVEIVKLLKYKTFRCITS